MNQIHSLQEEAIHFHERETNYVKYIRELEQKTEDLEKLQRFVGFQSIILIALFYINHMGRCILNYILNTVFKYTISSFLNIN